MHGQQNVKLWNSFSHRISGRPSFRLSHADHARWQCICTTLYPNPNISTCNLCSTECFTKTRFIKSLLSLIKFWITYAYVGWVSKWPPVLVPHLVHEVHSLTQCFWTAGPRPGNGPWHQLFQAARVSPGICHFCFLSIFLDKYFIVKYSEENNILGCVEKLRPERLNNISVANVSDQDFISSIGN